jgi:hypothetical protein
MQPLNFQTPSRLACALVKRNPAPYATLCPTRMDDMASASLACAEPTARLPGAPRVGNAERAPSAISPAVRVGVVGTLGDYSG